MWTPGGPTAMRFFLGSEERPVSKDEFFEFWYELNYDERCELRQLTVESNNGFE